MEDDKDAETSPETPSGSAATASATTSHAVDAWLAGCQTGDLFFVHGTHALSYIIQVSGGIPWSHVGMVVRSPESGHLCLWEATNGASTAPSIAILNPPPVADGDLAAVESPTWILCPGPTGDGTRLVSLRERVLEERMCGLLRVAHDTRGKVFEQRVYQFIHQKLGTPYEDDLRVVFNSWWDWCGLGANPVNTTTYFCSELIVDTLRTTGVMDATHGPGPQRNQPASEWTVADVLHLGQAEYDGGQCPLLALEYGAMEVFENAS